MAETSNPEEKRVEGFIDKTIDFLFSKDKRKYLILFFIIGFILRIILANNVGPLADEMVHGPHAIGISTSGALNLQNQAPLWSYLTDICFRVFGVTGISARFLSIFFGSFSILLVYLISKQIFKEKGETIGIIASFLLTISAFSIRYSIIEMDIAMIFFVLMSLYFFIDKIKIKKISYLSIVFMAIAVLLKPIALTFIPAYAFYFFYILIKEKNLEKRKNILKKNTKPIIIGIIVFLLFMSPVLVYNYLLYQEKGLTDVIFSRFLGIAPEMWQASHMGFERTFNINYLISEGLPFLLIITYELDLLIIILGLLGILLFSFNKKIRNKIGVFFILAHLIPLIFLTGTSLLPTHFVSFMPLLCIFSSFFILKIANTQKSIKPKTIVILILIIILIFNLFVLWPNLTSKSAVFKARDFTINNIEENAIVVADSRIYRGMIVFMFHDKHYVEAGSFPNILQSSQQYSTQEINVPVYFVECSIDDCGWGTVANQPEFNQSMEEITNYFKENSKKIKDMGGGGGSGELTNIPYLTIYKTTMPVKPQILPLIDSTHNWYFYPVGWEGERYDSYKTDYLHKKLLHKTGYFFLWLQIIIAILSPLILIKHIFFNKNEKPTNSISFNTSI